MKSSKPFVIFLKGSNKKSMITLKSPREIVLMREAGRIVASVFDALKPHIKPGVTTKELNRIAEKTIRDQGAIPSFLGYGGFPASICTSVNEVLVHGIPNNKPLKEGDIISVDVGAIYKGYNGDAARTYAVGKISDEAARLVRVTEESFLKLLKLLNQVFIYQIYHIQFKNIAKNMVIHYQEIILDMVLVLKCTKIQQFLIMDYLDMAQF